MVFAVLYCGQEGVLKCVQCCNAGKKVCYSVGSVVMQARRCVIVCAVL